jgi:F-type H+-transporting ATPase subunit epsilon
VLVRGGFADIGPTSVTVIAERANPFEEISPESIDRDIAAVELQRDATEDFAKKDELAGQIVQLRDAKVALNF